MKVNEHKNDRNDCYIYMVMNAWNLLARNSNTVSVVMRRMSYYRITTLVLC